MGGKTAMQFACDYPERTAKLLVADIAPRYYPPHHQDIINALTGIDFKKITSRAAAETELSKTLFDFGTRQFLLKNIYRVGTDQLGFRFNLEVLSQKMEEIGENIASVSTFNKPTLFLKGDKSPYISNNDSTEIKRHFPLAKLKQLIMQDIGCMPKIQSNFSKNHSLF